jgi:hypothetical protein
MGFLDNLESNLNSLERREERDTGADRQRRESDRRHALASAPYAERLRKGPFTSGLLDHATRIGFTKRIKVNIVWLGNTLRLEGRDRRLELKPGPDGVTAVFYEGGSETSSERVDLAGDPGKLAARWLS